MSLINEALKKAQLERNLGATPTASAPSGIAAAAVTTHVRTASHRSSQAPLWFGLGLLFLGAGVTAVVILFVLNPASAPVTSAAANQPAPATSGPGSPPKPAAAALTPAAEAPLPTITLPSMSAPVASAPASAPAPVPAPAPVVATPAPVAPAAPVARIATPPTAPAKLAAPPAAPVAGTRPAAPAPAPVTVARVVVSNDAKVYALLDKLRITVVRGTGIEARVLMNEKVYRINDLIDRELGLRLTEVSSSLLVFVDASGHKYQKPL